VWLNLVGLQPTLVGVWQLKQFAVVGTCVPGLPLAALPLWQVAQLVAAVKVPWSGFAPVQMAVDLWQLSHTVTPLWIGVAGLPTAGEKLPLWQLAHPVDTTTLACNFAPIQAV
jgi:hypothetical protein